MQDNIPVPAGMQPLITPPLPQSRSLLRAWLETARYPYRRTIATWANVTDRKWVIISLIVAAALALIENIVSAIGQALAPVAPSQSQYAHIFAAIFGSPATGAGAVIAVILSPARSIVLLLFVAYVIALITPTAAGTISARFIRVLKPWALISPITGLLSLASTTLSTGAEIADHSPVSPLICGATLVTLVVGVYVIVLSLNALAVGSGKSRWILFLLQIVVTAFLFAVFHLITVSIAAVFGFSL